MHTACRAIRRALPSRDELRAQWSRVGRRWTSPGGSRTRAATRSASPLKNMGVQGGCAGRACVPSVVERLQLIR
eukprot:3319633-Prymnesium_polylepis.1